MTIREFLDSDWRKQFRGKTMLTVVNTEGVELLVCLDQFRTREGIEWFHKNRPDVFGLEIVKFESQ